MPASRPTPSAPNRTRTRTQQRFFNVLCGAITGIVHHNGAVESVLTRPGGGDWPHHSTLWPGCTHGRWRWTHRESIHSFGADGVPEEVCDSIRTHLTKRYGLLWWENGHHDIDDLLAKAGVER